MTALTDPAPNQKGVFFVYFNCFPEAWSIRFGSAGPVLENLLASGLLQNINLWGQVLFERRYPGVAN